MMKVLEQATKVHCFAEEICDETTKGDWQPCAYQLYRRPEGSGSGTPLCPLWRPRGG
jgi:hypothetical protein